MASQTRSYEKKKLLGQVYTPLHIVEKILGLCDFYQEDPRAKSILDPACGDGRFLVPIVEHIIQVTPPELLHRKLSQVYGWDIDPQAIAKCRENLNKLVEPLGISVKWKLRRCDALLQRGKVRKFDLIVGNPPYIRIQHLPEKQRSYIRKEYTFCSAGSTDMYVAFFELASKLLSKTGICGFVTPKSYFISETGKKLRSYFESNRNLRHITNFADISVFDNASTYAAITVFSTEKKAAFTFERCIDTTFNYGSRTINFSELKSPWKLSVKTPESISGVRLGDICRISVGITTLADRYFLFTILKESGDSCYARSKNGDELHLERALLKPVIKGSKLKSAGDPVTEYILFPYQKNEAGKNEIIPEEMLQSSFPKAFAYFLKVKPALDRRDNGKVNPVAWYAFGRSQGLDSSFGRKIIFSPMNREPNFVLYENPDVTVYSGYFIKYEGDSQALLAQLNSQRMKDFVAVAGRDFQGGYKGYNKKVVENFIIEKLPD